MTRNHIFRIAFLLLLVGSCGAVLGCWVLDEKDEIGTLANLQALSARSQGMREAHSLVVRADFDSVVDVYFPGGKDPWGQPIIFVPAAETASTFLLVSTGRNGVLDASDPSDYFERTPGDGGDIVLRGSTAVSYGAHK